MIAAAVLGYKFTAQKLQTLYIYLPTGLKTDKYNNKVIVILSVYNGIKKQTFSYNLRVFRSGITALCIFSPAFFRRLKDGQSAAELFHGQVCVIPIVFHLQVIRQTI